jgi:hypothetical protein
MLEPHLWLPTTHFDQRLESVQETRGWKYFFKHTIRLPLTLVVGIFLGALIAVFTLMSFGLVVWPVGAVTPPPSYSIVQPPMEVPAEYLNAETFNNSCLIKNLAIPDGPTNFDACSFVITSTDEVWNTRGNVDAAIDKYFTNDYLDAGSWGKRVVGKKDLRDLILAQMRAFPDIKIHITDCLCKGNDNDGYKCAMSDVLTGTNSGPSGYGPATGNYAKWTGLVESLVKYNPAVGQWQYYAEWGVHDEWSLIQQLGLDFARVPHPNNNDEPLHDCNPLLAFSPQATIDKDDAKDQGLSHRI